MRKMNPVVDIGLPDLDEDTLDSLAEECEEEVTNFILREIPPKSIEELTISCSLNLEQELQLDIEVDIVQKYDTGHDLEKVINQASEFGSDWLEQKLRGMK